MDMTEVAELSDVSEMFGLVLRSSNRFLYCCTRWKIHLLKYESDPSLAELADIMREVAGMIEVLGHRLDSYDVMQAKEYCDLMVKMSAAIDRDDQIELNELTERLRRKPGAICTAR
jgi:hypothetical protein